MNAFLTKPRARVVAETRVVRTEIPKRKAVQMPAVRRIAEGAEIRVMRSRNIHGPARTEQPVKLLDGTDHIGYMLYDVHGADVIETRLPKRVRKTVDVDNDVGCGAFDSVDAYRSGILVDPAADIEDASSRSFTRSLRHSSSVSTAKSA